MKRKFQRIKNIQNEESDASKKILSGEKSHFGDAQREKFSKLG